MLRLKPQCQQLCWQPLQISSEQSLLLHCLHLAPCTKQHQPFNVDSNDTSLGLNTFCKIAESSIEQQKNYHFAIYLYRVLAFQSFIIESSGPQIKTKEQGPEQSLAAFGTTTAPLGGVRLIAVLKPVCILYEMTPPHSGSYVALPDLRAAQKQRSAHWPSVVCCANSSVTSLRRQLWKHLHLQQSGNFWGKQAPRCPILQTS